MHIGPNFQKQVVFVGWKVESANSGSDFKPAGTGFLVSYDGVGHLVTVRHVAKLLDGAPFVIRLNRHGRAVLLEVDMADWFYPENDPDELIDLAVTPINISKGAGYECVYLPSHSLLSSAAIKAECIDVGELSYIVGLFKFIQGRNQNLPIVYSVNVALMPPPGETIPSWDPHKKREDFIEAYLVESRAIDGASGSPVFVRPTVTQMGVPMPNGPKKNVLWPEARLHLLGVFQGAWFKPPDETVAQTIRARTGDEVVPVGIGIVVPAYKLIELLESGPLKSLRKRPPSVASRRTSVSELPEPVDAGSHPHKQQSDRSSSSSR